MTLNVKKMTIEQKLGHLFCQSILYDKEENIDFVLSMIEKKACTAIRISANRGNLNTIKRLREAADYPPSFSSKLPHTKA